MDPVSGPERRYDALVTSGYVYRRSDAAIVLARHGCAKSVFGYR